MSKGGERMNRVRIKLTKIPEKLSKKGGCRARVLDNGEEVFHSRLGNP